MSKEKQIDYKEYARQMRENCVRDHNGTEPIVICSLELWEEIATIIERFGKQSEGEWESDPSDDPRVDDGCVCSQCRLWVRASVAAGCFYCPSCGAKMRKEDEGK